MRDRTIVTPYFLERPVPQLGAMAGGGWTVNEPVFTGDTPQARLASAHRPIAAFVAETIKAGDRPVSIAGDCCAAIGVMAGLQHAGVGATLIWFDAHGDFNTWETTPSGPSSADITAVFTRLAGSGQIVAVSMSALNPDLDENGGTEAACMACLDALLA